MTRKKRNTDFRLGLDRKQLIEAAMVYGRDEKSAKKANTKTLENYVIKKVLGKEKNAKIVFPEFTPETKRNINSNANAWGVKDALKQLTYASEKVTGMRNEVNFLRLTMKDNFSLYYDGFITEKHVDELISKLPQLESTQVDSDMINISPFYRNLFIDFSDELEERENKKQNNTKS